MSGPFSEEDLTASAVDALKVTGDARAIAVLVAGTSKLEQWNSDWGIDYWRLFIALPTQLFHAMSEAERNETQISIEKVVNPFFAVLSSDRLESVVLAPIVAEARADWREEALRLSKVKASPIKAVFGVTI